MTEYSLESARLMDQEDPLKGYREEFYRIENKIYMDGNSLGLLSKRSESALKLQLEAWKKYGIDGWTEGAAPWFYLSEQLGGQMAPLIGADKDEVIVTGSTTVNLHQLVSSFYQPTDTRNKILADELTFPSDIYALQSQLRLKGYDPETHLVRVASRDGRTLDEADIIDAMTDEVALILLPGVLYRSGQILDMEKLTAAAHERGIIIGFDLCHSIGAIPHELDKWGADFAFWCNYKYLNAGPGSVASLYVNRRHFGRTPGLTGWFGSAKDKQFDMDHEMTPAETAGAYQIGTPHVLSTAPLAGSLEIFNEAGIENLRSKSLKLTRFMMGLIDQELAGFGFELASPVEDERRGGHIYLEHPEAARICKALKNEGVIPDFRAPKGIRLAPMALYNTFEDVWQVVALLKSIMEEEKYKNYKNERGVVA